MEFDYLNWLVIPFLIFIARVSDVSLGTMRIISLSQGRRRLAPILGFLEILIWLVAIRQVFSNLNNPACFIAYAAGFATGIYSGMWLEQKMAMGLRLIRIVTRFDSSELIAKLREDGYGVTAVEGEGNTGNVRIIYTILKRKNIGDVTAEIHKFNPNAFYTVEDVIAASSGIFPSRAGLKMNFWGHFIRYEKKTK